MKRNLVCALFLVVMVSGCVAAPQHHTAHRRQAPVPCSTPVQPIRNNNLAVFINVNYSYNAKDPSSARPWHRSDVVDHLNQLGKQDGNTFSEANGRAVNFYLTYTINNDGQDHFTGSLEFSGWGQGHVSTFYSGQYPYTDTGLMTRELTGKAYEFIHGGWHDSRPNCPQN
jgi:hypothetical protein